MEKHALAKNPLDNAQTPLLFHVERPNTQIETLISLHRNPSKRNVIAGLTERDGELVIEPMYVSKGMRSQTTANK